MIGDNEEGQGDGTPMTDITPDSRVLYLTLGLCSFTWALIGVGIILGSSVQVDSAYHLDIPDHLRLVPWWVGSVLALSTLITGKHPYCTIFTLMIGPAIRCTSYLGAWISYLVVDGQAGNADAWYYSVLQVPSMIVVVILALLLRPVDEGGVKR